MKTEDTSDHQKLRLAVLSFLQKHFNVLPTDVDSVCRLPPGPKLKVMFHNSEVARRVLNMGVEKNAAGGV